MINRQRAETKESVVGLEAKKYFLRARDPRRKHCRGLAGFGQNPQEQPRDWQGKERDVRPLAYLLLPE